MSLSAGPSDTHLVPGSLPPPEALPMQDSLAGNIKTVEIRGEGLTIEQVVAVARFGAKVTLSKDAEERIIKCRGMLEKKIEKGEIMYGVNTGIGELCNVVLSPSQVLEFQRCLIYNHSAGIGEPAPIEYVRGAMLGRINVQAHGNSGCRLDIPQTYVAMLNAEVTPYVCQKGSVGACGDLAPMSQIAQLLMGEGRAFYKGELLPGKQALKDAGIPVPGLKARDGLSAINGSNFSTAMSAIQLYDMNRLLKHAEIAASMSLEALLANLTPYTTEIHDMRGFQGAVRTAKSIRTCIAESDLATGKFKPKVQDAYSMRSSPQVIGTAHDALRWAREQIEIELNGVGDNPIFLPDRDITLTGANFQGSPVGLPMDSAGTAITMVCILSERRLNRLLNPNLSVGLPAFLIKGAGMYSGLMLSQYTADTLIVEQRILSAPASIQSIPAAADQEDFVSMCMNTALKNKQIIENGFGIVGIELLAAAQAFNYREFTKGKGCTTAFDVIRSHVPFMEVDRPLHDDHTTMRELVRSCEILEAVEKAVGSLE